MLGISNERNCGQINYEGYGLLTFYPCSIFFFLQFHTNVMGSFWSREGVTIIEGNRRMVWRR